MRKSKVNAWYGWVPDQPDYRDKLYSAIAAPPKKLPPKVDLRVGCSRVENQGQLGSCTANALVRDGVKSLVKLGVCSERKWPYKIAKFTQKPSFACYKEASDHQITSYHRITSLRQMRQCLAKGYPFSVSQSTCRSSQKKLPRPVS
jgi:hypothetical protein